MKPVRYCKVCGRSFAWRRKWKDVWAELSYCSKKCRRRRLTREDVALEDVILDLLEERPRDATICPSEAARRVRPTGWHELMESARMAARRLVVQGRIAIMQAGKRVDPDTASGPIRLKLLVQPTGRPPSGPGSARRATDRRAAR